MPQENTPGIKEATIKRPLRVLMLSWEYPPVVVGGLGRHVHALATSLAAAGHQVTVVTRHAPDAPLEEIREGVRVVRAPEDPPLFPLSTPTLLAWTMAFNHSLTRAALHAAATDSFDVIHAHDWLVTHAAVTMRDHLGIPLIATIHATEAGRHQGWLPDEMNKCIHSVEWWLGHEASKVLVCSGYMRWEVSRLLELAPEKIKIIPNGVDAPIWRANPTAVAAVRARFAGRFSPPRTRVKIARLPAPATSNSISRQEASAGSVSDTRGTKGSTWARGTPTTQRSFSSTAG